MFILFISIKSPSTILFKTTKIMLMPLPDININIFIFFEVGIYTIHKGTLDDIIISHYYFIILGLYYINWHIMLINKHSKIYSENRKN